MHTREIENDLYSDAMDSAVAVWSTVGYLQGRDGVSRKGEQGFRGQLAAAIRAFLEEIPGESGLVRLARPPAPIGNGTTVEVQPAAHISPASQPTSKSEG